MLKKGKNMSQFLSKEQANEYQKSVGAISDNYEQFVKKIEPIMDKEDFELCKKLILEPLKPKTLADILIKYKLLNPKMVAPEQEPGV